MTDRTARIAGIAIVAITGLLIGAVAAWRAMRYSQLHVDVDRDRYPVVGLDLSSHNGLPDFDSVATAGVRFVFLKASEGETFRDPVFIRNYAAARGAGIPVGAYHFFRFDCDGQSQAMNLLGATKDCRFELPFAIDVEEAGNPPTFSTALVVSRLEAMVATLRAAGAEVIIYTNKNGFARFLQESFSGSGERPSLWICSFTNPPLPRAEWLFWQHSHISHIPGIKGKVDMNTFNGDNARWNEWIGPRKERASITESGRQTAAHPS